MTFPALFLGYVLAVALALAIVLRWFLSFRTFLAAVGVLATWLGYAFILGALGVPARYDQVPPGLIFLVAPIIATLLIIAFSTPGAVLAARIPLFVLLGFQVFRVGVEMSLHHLWSEGQAPKLITLEGGNVEILVALSAPIAAWLATRGVVAGRFSWWWNVAGLLSLGNVVVRAVLTAPGPLNLIHAEVPDLAIITWPFTFVPGFMAPLAMFLHLLAFRGFAYRFAQLAPATRRSGSSNLPI